MDFLNKLLIVLSLVSDGLDLVAHNVVDGCPHHSVTDLLILPSFWIYHLLELASHDLLQMCVVLEFIVDQTIKRPSVDSALMLTLKECLHEKFLKQSVHCRRYLVVFLRKELLEYASLHTVD